jgi:hypothetical protein
MKIIKIEGCAGCPYLDNQYPSSIYCRRTLKFLDRCWADVNPYYIHPDCPLEDEEEKNEI